MRLLIDTHCADPLKSIIQEHLDSGGRRLRALLSVAAMETLGAPVEASIGWAAACELLHNATLIHDDLQDGDEMRRGRPTLWFRHGKAQAINAGDLLLIAPALAIAQIPVDEKIRWDLIHAVAQHCASIASGQAAELKMTAEGTVCIHLYREVVARKTSGLFELPVIGASLLAGCRGETVSLIGRAFRPLGVLYQLQDDVLDLFGDKGRQQVGTDLREGKISALVVHHLQLHPDDKPWLSELLSRPRAETTEREITYAIERFRFGGALAAVAHNIQKEAANVREAASASNVAGIVELVEELIRIMLSPIENAIDFRVRGETKELK